MQVLVAGLHEVSWLDDFVVRVWCNVDDREALPAGRVTAKPEPCTARSSGVCISFGCSNLRSCKEKSRKSLQDSSGQGEPVAMATECSIRRSGAPSSTS